MKLKYYMRGLGIGIILTTLILSLGGRKQKLSDQEIKKRAAALGMVEGNTDSSLDNVLDDMNPTGEVSVTPAPSLQPSPSVTGAPGNTASVSPAPSLSPAPDSSTAASPSPSKVPELTPVPTKTPDISQVTKKTEKETDKTAVPTPKTVPVPKANDDSESGKEGNVEFTIKSGMSSEKVSEMLEKLGLVDNAVDFNKYVADNNKCDDIRTGAYSLPKGASYEIILENITFH